MDILETIWVTSTVVIIMTNERALVWKASSLFFLYLSSVYLSCQKEYFTGIRSVQRGWGQQCLHICVRSADYTGSPQGLNISGWVKNDWGSTSTGFQKYNISKVERLKCWLRRFANKLGQLYFPLPSGQPAETLWDTTLSKSWKSGYLLIDRSGSRISIRWKSAFFKVEPSLVSEWWFFRLKGCIRT